MCGGNPNGYADFYEQGDPEDGAHYMSCDPVHWWPMSSSSHITGTYIENYEECYDSYILDNVSPPLVTSNCIEREGPLVHEEKIYGDHWVGLRSGCLYGANGYAGNFDSLIDLEGLPATGDDAGYFCDQNRVYYEFWRCSDDQYLTKEDCEYHDETWAAQMGQCENPAFVNDYSCTANGWAWTGSQEYCELDGHEWLHPYSKNPFYDVPSGPCDGVGDSGPYDSWLECPITKDASTSWTTWAELRGHESKVYLFNVRPSGVDIHLRAPVYISQDTGEGKFYDPTGVTSAGGTMMQGVTNMFMGWAKQVAMFHLTGTEQFTRIGQEDLPEGTEAAYENPNNKPIELFKESWTDERTLTFEAYMPVREGMVFQKPTDKWDYVDNPARYETLLEHAARIARGEAALGTTVDPFSLGTTTTPEFVPGSCAECLEAYDFTEPSINGYWRKVGQYRWEKVGNEEELQLYDTNQLRMIGNQSEGTYLAYSSITTNPCTTPSSNGVGAFREGLNSWPNGVINWDANFKGVEQSFCAKTTTTPDPVTVGYLPVSGWKETSKIKIKISNIEIDGLGEMPVDSYFAMEQSGSCSVSGHLQYKHQQEASIYTEGIVVEDRSSDPDLDDLNYPHFASDVLKRDGITFPTGDGYDAKFGVFNPDFAPTTKDMLPAPSRMQVRANEYVTVGTGKHNYFDLYRGAPYFYNRYLWPTISDLCYFNGGLLSWESSPGSDPNTFPSSNLLCSAAAGQPTANDETSIFTQRHYVVTQHWMFYDGVVTDPTINTEWMQRGNVGHSFFPGGGYVVPEGTTVNDIEQGIVPAQKTVLKPPNSEEAGAGLS
jgi:hypothetical protein